MVLSVMSTCDVEKDSTSGQPHKMSCTVKCKDRRVHLAQTAIHHHSAAQGYAAPTIASQLRMKLGGLPASSPCQRYKPVETFLPRCCRRDTSKTTIAKPLCSNGLTKRMPSDDNVRKSSDRTVRIQPANKTSSSGNKRLSKWHHEGFHPPVQSNGLKNKPESKRFSTTVSNSQLKDLNSDKGWSKQIVPESVKTNISRNISATKRPDEKSKEVLRGMAPKLNQAKRSLEKKTQSRATLELAKTINMKKDPSFEQMVEEEQHRWLAEVKQIEDKRKEFYYINENLCINFKVEWISYSIVSDRIPTEALINTDRDLQNRKKDLTEKLDIEVNEQKSKNAVFKKMNEEQLMNGSEVIQETSTVDGGSVADADQWSNKEMLVRKVDNNGGIIVEETSVNEAETCYVSVNSQEEGYVDEKSAEETLIRVAELGKSCYDEKSNAETEPGWLDGNYDKRNTGGQNSSADSCRLRDGNSSEFEISDGQMVTGMSPSITDGFEVKHEIEKLPKEFLEVFSTKAGHKELQPKPEIENTDINMAREESLPAAETNEGYAKRLMPSVVSGYKVSGDAADEDDVALEQSDADAGAFQAGSSDAAVMQCDSVMGSDIDARSNEEILERHKAVDEAEAEEGGCLSLAHMSLNINSPKHNSSDRVSFIESFQMSEGESLTCQGDTVMQGSCQEDPLVHKSVPKESDNVMNEADMQMSFRSKSKTTGSQDNAGLRELESNVNSSRDRDGRVLTAGFDKNSKKNLSSKENQKNVIKKRATFCDIPSDCTIDFEDVSNEDSGFNATVAVRDGSSARHSTTVDVLCLDVGSDHASVSPLITLISDSVSA